MITYVTDGAWGTGTGVPHTAAEADGIVYDLDTRLTDVEDNPVQPYQISNVTQSGSEVTFWLSNGDNFTVTLPTVVFRGAPVGADIDASEITDATWSAALTDLGKWFTVINGDLVVSLDEVDADAPIGAEMHFDSDPLSGGLVLIDGSTDITIKVKPGRLAQLDIGGVLTVKKLAAGIWRVFGDLSEDVTT